jgi:site-specific DNA-methyltransferase (cytosine-N4-specific)
MNAIYTTEYGKAFCHDSLDFMKNIKDNTFDLVLTSPPFALITVKSYGNKSEQEYIDWFLPFSKEIKRIIKPTGSFILDIGSAYIPKNPVKSIYHYKLITTLIEQQNFFLAGEFFHYNPSRLPGPTEWVNVKRIRVKDAVNHVWWLTKSEYPKADNKKVLKPYKKENRPIDSTNIGKRNSGHRVKKSIYNYNNGGSIPDNVLTLTNGADHYTRKCKQNGIKSHPARFPIKFAEFFIKFLTDEDDLIFDPFAGSNTTGFTAEQLKRKWISCELREEYVKNSLLRFHS